MFKPLSREKSTFLFSLDLEDVRDRLAKPSETKSRVVENTERYLEFLEEHNFSATFFTEGRVARKYPELIRRIANAGCELACHTDSHPELTKISREGFRAELSRNLDALYSAGAKNISGFRAPCFSLVEKSAWAYEVLAELGFTYSSSVLPANNPLYGWPEFGAKPRLCSGILELPITLRNSTFPLTLIPNVPFAGGVYFRVLPLPLLVHLFKQATKSSNLAVSGYFHPYDIDEDDRGYTFPGMESKPLWNFLMFYGRKSVLKKLETIISLGYAIERYDNYIESFLDQESCPRTDVVNI